MLSWVFLIMFLQIPDSKGHTSFNKTHQKTFNKQNIQFRGYNRYTHQRSIVNE